MDKDDGRPAFPVVAENGLGHIAGGMTLRDWFAGMAMQGDLSTGTYESPWKTQHFSDLAKRGYAMADAMLAERKK